MIKAIVLDTTPLGLAAQGFGKAEPDACHKRPLRDRAQGDGQTEETIKTEFWFDNRIYESHPVGVLKK